MTIRNFLRIACLHMKLLTYLAFFVLLALVAFLKGGLNSSTVYGFLLLAVVTAIPLYFGTRDRQKPASTFETILATVWLWLRRLVCFTFGAGLLFGAYSTVKSNPLGVPSSDVWLATAALTTGGLFGLYLGVFGQGTNRSELRDDIRLHSENKKRYRWWF